jgi:hypothetical protein
LDEHIWKGDLATIGTRFYHNKFPGSPWYFSVTNTSDQELNLLVHAGEQAPKKEEGDLKYYVYLAFGDEATPQKVSVGRSGFRLSIPRSSIAGLWISAKGFMTDETLVAGNRVHILLALEAGTHHEVCEAYFEIVRVGLHWSLKKLVGH